MYPSARFRLAASSFIYFMVDRIKALLQQRQLSTTQFADLVGVARPIISHVLSGRNKPSLEVVQRILAAFPDLSMAWLLNGTGPMLNGGPLPAAAATSEATTAPAAAVASVNLLKAIQTPVNESISTDSGVTALTQATVAPTPEVLSSAPPMAAPDVLPTETALLPLLPIAPRPLLQPAQRFARAAAHAPARHRAPLPPVLNAIPGPPALLAPQSSPAAPVVQPLTTPIADPAPAAAPVPAPGKAIRRIVIFYQDGSFSDFAPE